MLLSLFLLQSFTLRMKWTTFCERFDISNTPTIKVWTIEVRVPVNIPENNYKILFSSKLCFSFSIKIFHSNIPLNCNCLMGTVVWCWQLYCQTLLKQYVNIFSVEYELSNSFSCWVQFGVNVEYLCNITIGSAVLESYLLDVGHVCHLCSVFVSSPPYILV